jgi:diacylglycerol kinase
MTTAWQTDEPPTRVKPTRRWRDKFAEAFRGVRLGAQGQSSFFVHLFFACLAVLAAVALRCDPLEWCLIVGCIGLVFTAELFNSALETLFKGLDPAAMSSA